MTTDLNKMINDSVIYIELQFSILKANDKNLVGFDVSKFINENRKTGWLATSFAKEDFIKEINNYLSSKKVKYIYDYGLKKIALGCK